MSSFVHACMHASTLEWVVPPTLGRRKVDIPTTTTAEWSRHCTRNCRSTCNCKSSNNKRSNKGTKQNSLYHEQQQRTTMLDRGDGWQRQSIFLNRTPEALHLSLTFERVMRRWGRRESVRRRETAGSVTDQSGTQNRQVPVLDAWLNRN